MAGARKGLLHPGARSCGQHNYHPYELPSHINLRVNLLAPLTDGNMLPRRMYTMVAKEMSFSVGKTLRCDTYAIVMLASSTANNKKIIVKCVQKGHPELRSYIKYILPRETGLLKMLRGHPNVVRFIGLVETEKYAILATEYIEGTNLLDYITLKGKLNEDEARVIFKELLTTVSTCHSLGICIRGITCENVLLNNKLMPIISNFEHAIVQGYDMVDIFEGTPYSPPEVFCGGQNNPELVDVWTLGIVLYTMVIGVHPFEMESAVHSSLSFPVRISKACCSIIKKMLHVSPMKRIKMSELKRDIWLNNIALRSIDYQLTDTWFNSLSVNEKAYITHSFSAEISINNKHKREKHELDSDDVIPLEIDHVVSKPSKKSKSKKPVKFKEKKSEKIKEKIIKVESVDEESVAVKEEENDKAGLEYISGLTRDSLSGQSVHEYYSIINDLMDDHPIGIRSYKYKDATVNTIDQKMKEHVRRKKCTDAAVNTTEVNIIADQLLSPQIHKTQYLMVIAPPIVTKSSKISFFQRQKKTLAYNYPSSVNIDNQGSDVKLTLTLDDGQKKEFLSKTKLSVESGDLRLTTDKDFGEGSYTIQQMTESTNAMTGLHKLNLGASETVDMGGILNVLSRALPQRRRKSQVPFESIMEPLPRRRRRRRKHASQESMTEPLRRRRKKRISLESITKPLRRRRRKKHVSHESIIEPVSSASQVLPRRGRKLHKSEEKPVSSGDAAEIT